MLVTCLRWLPKQIMQKPNLKLGIAIELAVVEKKILREHCFGIGKLLNREIAMESLCLELHISWLQI